VRQASGVALSHGVPAKGAPFLGGPLLAVPAEIRTLGDDAEDGLPFEVPLEDLPHAHGFVAIHRQAPAVGVEVVAERQVAAGPLPLPARGDLFVGMAATSRMA